MYKSKFPLPRQWLEMNGQLNTPFFLSPRKESPSPLDKRLGGPQCRSGGYGEVKILDPTGT
jgi:hypothetical protein